MTFKWSWTQESWVDFVLEHDVRLAKFNYRLFKVSFMFKNNPFRPGFPVNSKICGEISNFETLNFKTSFDFV